MLLRGKVFDEIIQAGRRKKRQQCPGGRTCAGHPPGLRRQDNGLLVGELLGRVNLRRPTLYRLLHTLETKQFLTATGEPQRFRLGPAVAQLAHVWSASQDVAATVEPILRKLWEHTQETVALFIVEGGCRRCIAEIPSLQVLSFKRGVGYREDLRIGASGRAILAHVPDRKPALKSPGARSATDEQVLSRELALIRKRGYAVSNSEVIQGAVAVAAPFFNGAGAVAGSIALFGPSARIADAQISRFGCLLVQQAREISRSLGQQELSESKFRNETSNR